MLFRSFYSSPDGTGVLDKYKIDKLKEKFIIQQDNDRSYLVFNSMDDMIKYRKSVNIEMFHEVILRRNPRKFFLDIDYKAEIDTVDKYTKEYNWFSDTVRGIKELLIGSFNAKYSPLTITNSDILDVISHSNIDQHLTGNRSEKFKFSMNLIIDKYRFPNYEEFSAFGRYFIGEYDDARGSSPSIIDNQFYSESDRVYIQNRMVFSTKKDSLRYKYPLVNGEPFTDSDALYKHYILQYKGSLSQSKTTIIQQTWVRQSGIYLRNDVELNDEVIKQILDNTREYWEGFSYRDNKDNYISFNRNTTDGIYCVHCKEEHHKDNFLYFVIDNYGNVYRKCYQNKAYADYIWRIDGYGDPEHVTEQSDNQKVEPTHNLDKSLYWTKPLLGIGAKINVVTEQTILPHAFTNDRLNLIKAEMKMGKSKALIEYLSSRIAESQSPLKIIFVSFRRTFSAEAKSKYSSLGFKSYSDSDVPNFIDMNQYNKIIIQVESLHRIAFPIGELDYLIMDEVESIWSQFSSTNFHDFYGSYNVFDAAMRLAKQVIVMDANLSIRTSRLLASNFIGSDVNIYINKFNPNYQYKYYVIDKDKWLTHLNTVVKEESANVAIFTNSLKEAKTLKSFLTSTTGLSKSDIKMYNSKTKESVKSLHFSNVNHYWSNYRVVICTPTVSAGVSFEAKHFDYIFGYFTDKSCNVETCRQMLGRVRNINSNEVYISMIGGSDGKYQTNINNIRKTLIKNRQELVDGSDILGNIGYTVDIKTGEAHYEDTFVLKIILENIAFDNHSRNNFIGRMINQLSGESNGLHYKSEIIRNLKIESSLVFNIKDAYTEVNHSVKNKMISQITDAEVITDEKYYEIIEKSRNMCDISMAEHNSTEKYKITKTLGINPLDLNKKMAEQFNKPPNLERFNHNKELFAGKSWQLSIDDSRAEDRYLNNDVRHRARDTIMFAGPIHQRMKDLCDILTINVLFVVTIGDRLSKLNICMIKDKKGEALNKIIVDLLPMIDIPYNDKFYKNNDINNISDEDYCDITHKVLAKFYGFRYTGEGNTLRVKGMKDVLYKVNDKLYLNSKPYTKTEVYPTVIVNWDNE